MLNDQRAREIVGLFHSQWMKLEVQESASDSVAQKAERVGFNRTIESIVLGDDLDGDGKTDSVGADTYGSIQDLFSTEFAFLNADSKTLYETSGNAVAQGHGGFDKYRLNGDKRGGVLSRVAFLRSSADALHRGLFIRQEVLCHTIPEPPPDAAGQPLPSVAGKNPRELFKLHTQDPGCAGCHVLMDPLGYPLDNFDENGQWRDMYGDNNQFIVDASGNLVLTDQEGPFEGAQELQHRLGQSSDVQTCYTYKWFQHNRENEGKSVLLPTLP